MKTPLHEVWEAASGDRPQIFEHHCPKSSAFYRTTSAGLSNFLSRGLFSRGFQTGLRSVEEHLDQRSKHPLYGFLPLQGMLRIEPHRHLETQQERGVVAIVSPYFHRLRHD